MCVRLEVCGKSCSFTSLAADSERRIDDDDDDEEDDFPFSFGA